MEDGPLWVIVPTLNEADNIEKLLGDIKKYIRPGDHILVIDDSSTDGTGEIVRGIDGVSLIVRKSKGGIGSAYKEGFSYAIAQGAFYVIQMDADFSHNPRDIVRLLHEIKNYDLVLGSRYINGGKTEGCSFTRRTLSRCSGWLSRTVLSLQERDPTAGFRCWRASSLASLDLDKTSSGYFFQVETLYLAKDMRIKEMAIVFRDRREGHSKMSTRAIVSSFYNLLAFWKSQRAGFQENKG